MVKLLDDERGEINPLFLKIGMGAACVLILACVGVSSLLDKQSEYEYQKWAREENQKVFDASRQTRLTERQLLKLKRELNDSFYQRLEHDLPVRILIVGDAYGNGFGASNKSEVWSRLLQTGLKKKFGVKVEVENITLSGMNGGYGAWARLMSLPEGGAGKVLSDAGAVKDKQGFYTGEVLGDAGDVKEKAGAGTGEGAVAKTGEGAGTGENTVAKTGEDAGTGRTLDTRTVAASRENEYDLCIVSLGMTDEPQMFELYYEGVLREVRRKFEKCSIISLLANQAMTAPELGYADDNYDALYRISKHYDADVLNVGLEMTDPDAALKGATMSQLPYGSATSESLAADMKADGISSKKVDEISAKDLEARTAAAEEAIRKYTIDGLYLNNAGQKFLSQRILQLIEKKVSKSTGYDYKEVSPLRKEVVTLDQYCYFPVSELVRLDDFTYVLAENRVKTAAGMDRGDGVGGPESSESGKATEKSESTGSDKAGTGSDNVGGADGKALKPEDLGSIVGLDYELIPGLNDVYAAVGDGTEAFGRITQSYEGTGKEHFITPLNEGYSCEKDGNLIIGFSTKNQADTLHGVIIGGDFTLPSYFDGYQQVPYIGLTDENGEPVALDKDGRPAGEGSSVSESTAGRTAASEGSANATNAGGAAVAGSSANATNAGGAAAAGSSANATVADGSTVAGSLAAGSSTPETAAIAETAGATETTAATFGNDQPGQGNAAALAESFNSLTEAQQAAEGVNNETEDQQAAEGSNDQAGDQQAAEGSSSQTGDQQAADGSSQAGTQQAADGITSPADTMQAADGSEALSENSTESYPEGEVVYIHNETEGAGTSDGSAYTG